MKTYRIARPYSADDETRGMGLAVVGTGDMILAATDMEGNELDPTLNPLGAAVAFGHTLDGFLKSYTGYNAYPIGD